MSIFEVSTTRKAASMLDSSRKTHVADDDALARAEERVAQRKALVDRLRAEDADDLADILDECGQRMDLTCTCCGATHTVRRACRKRWCPCCARIISAKRVARYSAAVAALRWPLFVTLTRPTVKVITLEVVKDMRRALRKMRAQKWWSAAVSGGVASVEIDNNGNGWQPHMHCVVDAKWLAVKTPRPRPMATRAEWAAKGKQAATEIGAAWAKCLGLRRAGVNIKRAYGTGADADPSGNSPPISVEVLKYACKPAALLSSPDPIAPLLRVMGAARLVSSWGSCYRLGILDEEPGREPVMCQCGESGQWIPSEIVDRWVDRVRYEASRTLLTVNPLSSLTAADFEDDTGIPF